MPDAESMKTIETEDVLVTSSEDRRLPRWVVPAVIVFWSGFLGAMAVRFVWGKLQRPLRALGHRVVPGACRRARCEPAWPDGVGGVGAATALILFGVMAMFLVFVGAIGTLVGSQIADLLQDSETYISDSVDTINDTFGTNLDAQEVIDDFNDPNGAVQEFIADQQDNVVRLSVAALGVLLQLFSVLLFTFYLVADGPKLRRAICSRLTPRARSASSGSGSWPAQRPVATSTAAVCWRCSRRSSTGSSSSRWAPPRRWPWRCGWASSASSCPWWAPTSPACCPCS